MSEADLDALQLEALEAEIKRIGVARFVGRINSGVVEPTIGYMAVDSYVAKEEDRPLLSKLSHFLLCKPDSYIR